MDIDFWFELIFWKIHGNENVELKRKCEKFNFKIYVEGFKDFWCNLILNVIMKFLRKLHDSENTLEIESRNNIE